MINELLQSKLLPLIAALAVFIGLTFVLPATQSHVLKNLEPYPDGLFYVLPAWRLTQGMSFTVSHQNLFTIPARILPLYSLLLIPAYFLTSDPAAFYLTNVALGVLGISGLYLLLRRWQLSNVAVYFGVFTYIAHLTVIWLPSVPMAENLGLTLFIWTLVGVAGTLKHWWQVSWVSLAVGLLVLIKYNFVGVAVVLSLFLFHRLYSQRQYRFIGLAMSWSAVLLGIWLAYQYSLSFNPLSVFNEGVAETTGAVVSTPFYSLSYVSHNLWSYLSSLIGKPSQLLWVTVTFSNLGIFILFLTGTVLNIRTNTDLRSKSWLLIALFLSQFLLIAAFYMADTRYLILSLPLLAIGVSLFAQRFQTILARLAVTIVLVSLIFQQRTLIRQVLAANLGGRSHAWQYEAVKIIETSITDTYSEKSYVITALPPLLFDIYTRPVYRILPLSLDQEFLDKQEYVWGSDVDYQHLLDYYSLLLEQGQTVYVSAAYLTAESRFSTDFEAIVNRFNLELVAAGCLDTCNMYRMHLK